MNRTKLAATIIAWWLMLYMLARWLGVPPIAAVVGSTLLVLWAELFDDRPINKG